MILKKVRKLLKKSLVVQVNNLIDYTNLPKKERELFGFWYKTPNGYMLGGGNFHQYWRDNYPIQHAIREFFYNINILFSVKNRVIGEKITWLFKPQNKWARKSIPRSWSEYDTIMQDILFNGLVSYVDEGGFENIDWDYDERFSAIRDRIMSVYNFVKKELPERIKREEELLSDLYKSEVKGAFKNLWEDSLENGIKPLEGKRKHKFLLLNIFEEETEELIAKNMKEVVELRTNLW